jgi:hypothetical protein
MLVEPARFFADQEAMGIHVEWLAGAVQRGVTTARPGRPTSTGGGVGQ